MLEKLRNMLGSRKVLFLVLGIVLVALNQLQESFGLTLDANAVVMSVAVVLVYIFGEGQNDLKRMKSQIGKFRDPAFWIGLTGGLIPVVNTAFDLDIPVAIVNTALTFLLGLIFRKRSKEASR